MQIRQLEYFIAVSEHLNFTRAAEQFFISQTAVSQQIKALEDEVGAKLFNRNNRRVELTAAGKTFLEDAKAIVRRTHDSLNRVKSSSSKITGNLHIGFIKGFEKTVLSDIISKFHFKYPNIRLTLARENVSELYDYVLDHSLDIVFNMKYSENFPKEMNFRLIRKYSLVVVIPFSHPFAHRTSIKRIELKGYPLVDIKQNSSRYDETLTIKSAFAAAGFMPEISYISDDNETSVLAVAAGLGYALIPSYFTDTLSSRDRIKTVSLEGEEETISIGAAWHAGNKKKELGFFLNDCLFPAIENKIWD